MFYNLQIWANIIRYSRVTSILVSVFLIDLDPGQDTSIKVWSAVFVFWTVRIYIWSLCYIKTGLFLCRASSLCIWISEPTGTNWKSIIFPRLTSNPLEMCLIDPDSVIFTPRRFQPPMAALSNVFQPDPCKNICLPLSFVRMTYLPTSTSEVWGWASSAFLKRRKYALLERKKKGVAEKWERLTEKQRQTGGLGWTEFD